MTAPRSQKVTIKDVAREAGVSITTVSNVLSDKSSEVSDIIRDKVLKKIDELGYVKNMAASSLSSRRSRIIALVMVGAFDPDPVESDQSVNPFYSDLLFRLEHEARQKDYALLLYAGRSEKAVRFLLQRNVDAAILVGLTPTDTFHKEVRHNIPLILFDSLVEDEACMQVRSNEVMGGELSAHYLLERGCKKLVFLGDVPKNRQLIPSLRFKGAKKVCAEAGVPLELISIETEFHAAWNVADQILRFKPDGIITAADILAAGAIEGLQFKGMNVPRDIAVMGYDNLFISTLVRPTLSTIDQRLADKVRAVVELIESGKRGDIRVIEPILVPRESA